VNDPGFSAVVPAAGSGQRMGAGRPKQYLPLAGRSVIEHALASLLDHPGLRRLAVVLAPGDDRFRTLPPARDERIVLATGGLSRADSVTAGLEALAGLVGDTLVLVHDAARPCLSRPELDRLLAAAEDPAGALLALPVRDTLKRERGDGRVARTVDRAGLWQALTPQAFRLHVLREALRGAREGLTDESFAMERAGHAPRLVEGNPCNIKVTRPGDLDLAGAILASRTGEDR